MSGDYEEYRDARNNVMRRLHYIHSPYGLVAVVEKTGTNYDVRYVMTDYLGSICAVMDNAGNVLQQVSFDAWGRRRDPQTWALYGVTNALPSALYFGRGYTGHEHLEKFDLINMNGRMYDPTLCRMLSVDNYNNNVSSTIGMNRYAYALNNPLKFVDPDGNKSWYWAIAEALSGGTFSASLIATTLTVANNYFVTQGGAATISWITGAISKEDIKEGDRRATNSWRIYGGLFQYDHIYSGKGDIWRDTRQVASRFTWETNQTGIGYSVSQFANVIGEVKSVEYLYGATYVIGLPKGGEAFTLGSFINISPNSEDPNGESEIKIGKGGYTTMHEYGHYLQSQRNGPLYLLKYAIPSYHDAIWTEIDANSRAANYFSKADPNFQWIETLSIYRKLGKIKNAKWFEYIIPFLVW